MPELAVVGTDLQVENLEVVPQDLAMPELAEVGTVAVTLHNEE